MEELRALLELMTEVVELITAVLVLVELLKKP